jgi:hypothetical protein
MRVFISLPRRRGICRSTNCARGLPMHDAGTRGMRRGGAPGPRRECCITIALNHITDVVAGLVPATPNFKAQRNNDRGGRDKPGHDPREMFGAST